LTCAREARLPARKQPETRGKPARNLYALAAQNLLLLLLAAVPLAFTPLTQDRYSQIKWAILQLLIPFLLVSVLLALWPRPRDLLKGPMIVPALLFVACAFLSVFFAENKPWAARTATNLLYMMALMIACKGLLLRGLSVRKVLVTVTIVSTLVAFLGIVQYYGLFGQRQIADSYGELHTPSTIGHNNFAAAYIIMAVPAAVALLVSAGTAWIAAGSGLCLVIQLYYLLITASRGGWAGCLVSMAFWAAWACLLPAFRRSAAGAPRWRHKAIVVILPLVCAVGALIIVSPSTRLLVTDKAASFIDLTDKPVEFRLLTWKSTLSMIAEHPVGVGLANYEMLYPQYRSVREHRITGRFKKVQRTHNEYLQTVAELGPQGLIAFLFLVVSFFRAGLHAARTAEMRGDRLALQAIVVGQLAMLVHSFFSFPLQLPVTLMMFWVFCGVVSASPKAVQEAQRRPPAENRVPSRTALALVVGAVVVTILQLSSSELFSEYHQSQGLSLKEKAKYKLAAAQFQRASEFCGSSFLNHYLASVCLRNTGKIDEAIDQSVKSLECNPNDRHSIFNLGALYSYKGWIDEAIELWKRVLSIDPDYAQAYFNMGAVYAHRGEDGLALSAYENALRIDPSLRQACHNMVVILEKLGKLAEARDALVRCVENVQDLQLHLDLARVYARLGEIGNSQRTLIEAKELFGKDDRIDELFRKLPR